VPVYFIDCKYRKNDHSEREAYIGELQNMFVTAKNLTPYDP
jgi:hypothetical protein